MITKKQLANIVKKLTVSQKAVVLMLGNNKQHTIYEGDLFRSVWGLRSIQQLYGINDYLLLDMPIVVSSSSTTKAGKKRTDEWMYRWRLTSDGLVVYKQLKAEDWYLADA